MKSYDVPRIFWLLLSLIVIPPMLSSGCSMGAAHHRLHGTWTWNRSVGGFAGWTLTPHSEGYTQRLQLGPDRRFRFFRDDTLVARGEYALETSDQGDPVLRYETTSTWWFFAEGQYVDRAGPDTLELRDRCDDCFLHTFVRKQ